MATNETYEQFVKKFTPKKTTDDCYTPENVYIVISDWVCKEYNADKSKFVRPFYPGGDYEKYNYLKDCFVVDNPPFSILTKIIKFYLDKNIKFFLFAPTLTLFSSNIVRHCTCIATGENIVYENGAKVPTSFLTNMDAPDVQVRTAPVLENMIKQAVTEYARKHKKSRTKYSYPSNVLTSARMAMYGRRGLNLQIKRSECIWINRLDAQIPLSKKIYGSGFLLSKAGVMQIETAKEKNVDKKPTFVLELSHREKIMIESLEKNCTV